MITLSQWQSLKWLKQTDFNHPDKLDWSVVWAYDKLCEMLNAKPEFLSDFRYDDKKQHGKGRAIDANWPRIDPLHVWNTALRLRVFSGLGAYLNDRGSTSFHFDTRTESTVASPALWGAIITHPIDPNTGAEKDAEYEYTTAQGVLSVLSGTPGMVSLVALAALGYVIYKANKT